MRMEFVGQARPAGGGRVSGEDEKTLFARVVLPHLGDAFALARWLTGDRADAEDVVQDACLRALRGIGGFSGGNSRAWVLTIVRHTAYTWLGKNRPATLVVTDDLEAVERAEVSRRRRRERRGSAANAGSGIIRQSRCGAARRRDPKAAAVVPGDPGAPRSP